jgi:hypothetical protein
MKTPAFSFALRCSPLPALLLLAAPVAAQDDRASLEARVQQLERAAQAPPRAEEAAVRVSRLAAPDFEVPDLQGDKPPSITAAVDLKFWGRVSFATTYDNFQGSGGVGGLDFQNYVTKEGDEELSFNPRDSRFGFAGSSTFDDWTGRAVVEIDFYGANSGSNLLPRIRLAYVEVVHRDGLSVRAGQDWLPIAVQNPGMLDFGILAWSGNVWNRMPQITGRYKTGDFETTMGLLHARVSSAQDQQERLPWVVGRLAWTGFASQKGVLAIDAGYRQNTITPTAGAAVGVDHEATSHMLAVEGKLPIGDSFAITAEAWTGAGLGAEFLRSGLDYDATGAEMQGAGGFVSAEWKIDPKWSVNCGYGLDDPANEDTTTRTAFDVAVPYDRNHTVFANVRCQWNQQFGAGVEALQTVTDLTNDAVSGDDGSRLRGLRLTLGMWYVF